MVTINELIDIHVNAYKDLSTFEPILDEYIRAAWKKEPLGTSFTFSVLLSQISKEAIIGLSDKYRLNGWLIYHHNYPSITVSVSQVTKFSRQVKSILTGPKEDSKRAVKVAEK